MNHERIIVIDLQNNGYTFMNKIMSVIDIEEINYQQVICENVRLISPSAIIPQQEFNNICYRKIIQTVYELLISDLSSIICHDKQEFLKRLSNGFDGRYFSHFHSLKDEHKVVMLNNYYKEFAFIVYTLMIEKVNPDNKPCDYLINSATGSYMVVSQIFTINNNI